LSDTTPTAGPGKSLATFDPSTSAFPALFSTEGEGGVAEVLEDNFGDDGFSPTDLDRLTVPSGGGTAWDIPDEDPERVVSGVIIHKQQTRSFWFKKRGEDGEDDGPPDCYSADGKAGVGVFGAGSEANPSGACADCPMNVFGSSDTGSGNGKACKEHVQVFLLQPENVLPIQVSLPPTSLKNWKKYMTRLAAKGRSYMSVITALSLEVAKGGGQTYSVVVPNKVGELAPEETAAARAYGATIKGFLEQAAAARAQASQAEQESAQKGGTDSSSTDAPKAAGDPAKA
jgi:hypothetical protein